MTLPIAEAVDDRMHFCCYIKKQLNLQFTFLGEITIHDAC